ncbi:MAG: excinuclease ABC subunit UvrA [Bacteroidales bacterium]|nr:excinuclease ABC subunit UvrA [Bacteroidales bacterium]
MGKETKQQDNAIAATPWLTVHGARVNNLKNIDVAIPLYKLSVITGRSGSGKSSLAFDTLYAEASRRYIETFSAYARHFMGHMERPDVDDIQGLSPVIAIEQKTTNKSPRSTVGTVTEIADFLRLLFARVGEAYSYLSGEKMVRYTEEQIIELIFKLYTLQPCMLLAPIVKGRKGHYRELFESLRRKGFLNVRVDGEVLEITPSMKVDRYKNHDIELVVDKLIIEHRETTRLKRSLQTALRHGNGVVMVQPKSAEPRYFSTHLSCPVTGLSYAEPAPHNFSFNTPKGACSCCNGLGEVSMVDITKLIPNNELSISQGAIAPLGKEKATFIFRQLAAIAEKYDFTIDTPVKQLPPEAMNEIFYGSPEALMVKGNNIPGGMMMANYEGLVRYLEIQQEESTSTKEQRWAEQFYHTTTCPECHGDRLNREALHYRVGGKNIAELCRMDIIELREWINNLHELLDERQQTIATEIIKEISTRLQFLEEVGLGYLSLSRGTATLSGGESQRIHLATQIGSQLVNVLYILDEPSIGLHQKDNRQLIASLKELRDHGNTVVVVEHDEEMMREADYIVDLGPGAGRLGGEVVFQGTPREMHKAKTLTANYLNGVKTIAVPTTRREGNGKNLVLVGATGHNLKKVTLSLPLGKLICITGVSGSGKSSLISGTLYPALAQHFYRSTREALPFEKLEGLDNIDKVIVVDQSPIGRTPRSNPVTYSGVFTDIRNLFASLTEAKMRGYKGGRFSFNTAGGRCEVCRGTGYKQLEMNFLPNVMVKCEACRGSRYNRETLEVRFKGKSIADVLDMTFNQAVEFFENMPSFVHKLAMMQRVGLGYIKLGQAATTLSGGESQRLKLATELAKRDTGKTLYILDEPTTGLHFEDINLLLDIINTLVDRGNTVVVIEHNLDVIKSADHLVDLGPGAGREGGKIVAEGTPEKVIKSKKSLTAQFLREVLVGKNKTKKK